MILTQQPALFDRVFHKLFTEEIAEAAESVSLRSLAANKEEPAAWAFQRLWDRRGSQAASLLPKPRAATAVSHGLSRYETDFQVQSCLKQGVQAYRATMLRARLTSSGKSTSRPDLGRQGVLASKHRILHKAGLCSLAILIVGIKSVNCCRSCVRWAKVDTASWLQLLTVWTGASMR